MLWPTATHPWFCYHCFVQVEYLLMGSWACVWGLRMPHLYHKAMWTRDTQLSLITLLGQHLHQEMILFSGCHHHLKQALKHAGLPQRLKPWPTSTRARAQLFSQWWVTLGSFTHALLSRCHRTFSAILQIANSWLVPTGFNVMALALFTRQIH